MIEGQTEQLRWDNEKKKISKLGKKEIEEKTAKNTVSFSNLTKI